MKKKKNKAAVSLGKLRWKGKTAAEKLSYAKMMVDKRLSKRYKKLVDSDEERCDFMGQG